MNVIMHRLAISFTLSIEHLALRWRIVRFFKLLAIEGQKCEGVKDKQTNRKRKEYYIASQSNDITTVSSHRLTMGGGGQFFGFLVLETFLLEKETFHK